MSMRGTALAKGLALSEDRVPAASGAGTAELKWLPIPLDFWVPAGLKDFQEAWFMNLLRASLRSDYMGYLILCEEGCSGCPACLWRVANAHHPEHFRKYSSLVLACFNSAQIAGRRVLYFRKLVETVKVQHSKIRKHRSRSLFLSETCTGFNREGGIYSPSETLSFDFDFDSKIKAKSNTREGPPVMPNSFEKNPKQEETETREAAERILRIVGLPETHLNAAVAAVEAEKAGYVSIDGVVQHICDDANHARRRRVSVGEFLEDFLARKSARTILDILNLPISDSHVFRLAPVVKAEAKDTGLSLEDAARKIQQAASDARGRGVKIDMFYFDDMTWRHGDGAVREIGASIERTNRVRESLLAAARSHVAERTGPDGGEREGGIDSGVK